MGRTGLHGGDKGPMGGEGSPLSDNPGNVGDGVMVLVDVVIAFGLMLVILDVVVV